MSIFSTIPIKKPKRNRFDLSHDVKTTAKFGNIMPIFCQPVIPGDTFRLNTEILCRFAPFQAPVMHRVNVYTHFFFVPNRLIWDKWEEFITGGPDGNSDIPYPRFKVTAGDSGITPSDFGDGSLADYLGFPSWDTKSGSRVYDALPFRAYLKIYNDYYRDENLSPEIDLQSDLSGEIDFGRSDGAQQLFRLRKRAWKKDYFTSALPFAQRGADVLLPIQGEAPLIYNADTALNSGVSRSTTAGYLVDSVGRAVTNIVNLDTDSSGHLHAQGGSAGSGNPVWLASNTGDDPALISRMLPSELSKMVRGVDLTNATSTTINELRRAFAAQRFLEAMARGGSRYIEQIYSIFGVKSSDARLQRAEYLGGGKSPVVISDVLQTSQTTDGNPLATPAGHGVSVQNTHSFKSFFEEHGWIIGVMSIMPTPAYQQGLPKIFTKFDRYDYYWPQFAHLGEQEIKESEIFYNGQSLEADATDNPVFGYTPRYAEYKYIPDSVHGDFRGNLSFWHMGRIFTSPPKLNESFITNVQDAANRPFSVQDADFDKIWISIHHNCKAVRPMPYYGTPRI